MNADLHSHSTVSDGLLNPTELVRRAVANRVELFALTDHDELDGLAEARAEALVLGVRFVEGVEISVSWGDDVTVHVLGLGIDGTHEPLQAALGEARRGRDARAMQIAAELDKVGIHDAYEGARRHAGNPALISRAHFARYIVELGRARDFGAVFDHWLAKGKPGYVKHAWASLALAVSWIHAAGGLAVIAHPIRYRLPNAELGRLLAEFKDMGGDGIEVLCGSHGTSELHVLAGLARRHGFLASTGSDFHGPGESWVDLGKMPPLPDDLLPVWSRWN